LAKLDLAAHRYLIEHENVQSATIARVVQDLVGRLTDALQPLLDSDTRELATSKLRSSLNRTLRLAVQIRTQTLVAGDRFEVIWPFTGASFEGNEMEARELSATTGSRVVRLPICAGLKVFTRDKTMVDCRALEANGPSDAAPKFVIKASVLC
jgi:hypothetical protein